MPVRPAAHGSVYLLTQRSWRSRIGTGLRKCNFSRPRRLLTTSPAFSSSRRCFATRDPGHVVSRRECREGLAVAFEQRIEQGSAGRIGQGPEDRLHARHNRKPNGFLSTRSACLLRPLGFRATISARWTMSTEPVASRARTTRPRRRPTSCCSVATPCSTVGIMPRRRSSSSAPIGRSPGRHRSSKRSVGRTSIRASTRRRGRRSNSCSSSIRRRTTPTSPSARASSGWGGATRPARTCGWRSRSARGRGCIGMRWRGCRRGPGGLRARRWPRSGGFVGDRPRARPDRRGLSAEPARARAVVDSQMLTPRRGSLRRRNAVGA